MNETWIHNHTPDSHRQSGEWTPASENCPMWPKTQMSAGKVLAFMLWNTKLHKLKLELLPIHHICRICLQATTTCSVAQWVCKSNSELTAVATKVRIQPPEPSKFFMRRKKSDYPSRVIIVRTLKKTLHAGCESRQNLITDEISLASSRKVFKPKDLPIALPKVARPKRGSGRHTQQ